MIKNWAKQLIINTLEHTLDPSVKEADDKIISLKDQIFRLDLIQMDLQSKLAEKNQENDRLSNELKRLQSELRTVNSKAARLQRGFNIFKKLLEPLRTEELVNAKNMIAEITILDKES